MSRLRAGAASVNITPPIGVDLCGFGNRMGPSNGVHDDLFARALYLENEGRALILTSDLIGLDYQTNDQIRQGIADATGLGFDEIMIGCSHTHSGPATPCLPTLGKVDADALSKLRNGFISAGQLAFSRAEDAWAGHAREAVDVGMNRRQLWGIEPRDDSERGFHIQYADVLVVNSSNGPIARLFVHPAHGVTMGGDNRLISADWMGYAQRFVEKLEPGVVPMFGQGCCGNVNSEPRGTFEVCEAQGRAMACAVMKATELAHPKADPIIATARETFKLPCFDPPALAEAQAILAEAQENLAKAKEDGGYTLVDMYEGIVKWAQWQIEMSEQNATGFEIDYEAQAIRIGDFAIVGLPGEVFVEYAVNIDARSPFQQTAVMAYTNGNPGYIPTAAAHEFGGYEVTGAYRFYNGGYMPLKPEAERIILDAADRVLSTIAEAGN